MIRFARIYEALRKVYGPQEWWPADNPFEIMLGALLVQRTTWKSAATAIQHLQQAGIAEPRALQRAPLAKIEACIKGAGFFRTKARRLKLLAAFVVTAGGTDSLAKLDTRTLRDALLSLQGVGPETADAILLYAFERPVVVIDQYLRRFAARLTAQQDKHADRDLRRWIARDFSNARELNELHALIVAHGKASCASAPRCYECRIRSLCLTGKTRSDT